MRKKLHRILPAALLFAFALMPQTLNTNVYAKPKEIIIIEPTDNEDITSVIMEEIDVDNLYIILEDDTLAPFNGFELDRSTDKETSLKVIDSIEIESVEPVQATDVEKSHLFVPLEDGSLVPLTEAEILAPITEYKLNPAEYAQREKIICKIITAVKHFPTKTIPDTVYFNQDGYWGYLAKESVYLSTDTGYVAQYYGVVYKSKPINRTMDETIIHFSNR